MLIIIIITIANLLLTPMLTPIRCLVCWGLVLVLVLELAQTPGNPP